MSIEHVTTETLSYYESLTKFRGRLNISRKNPKVFTFGNIANFTQNHLTDYQTLTFCVFEVNVGRSFPSTAVANSNPTSNYDSLNITSKTSSTLNYQISSSDQVRLTHIILTNVGRGDKVKQWAGNVKCNSCGREAMVRCEACGGVEYCESCDALAHMEDNQFH